MHKQFFNHSLIKICKDFLKDYENWNEPNKFELDGLNELQTFQKDGYNIGIIQNKYDAKIWTFVYRKKYGNP